MSLKVLDLFLGTIFIICSCCNSWKVNISLLSKYFWIFLINWFLNCSSRCFKGLFFLAGDVFFNFSFSQFRKILIQSMKYFLAVFDYSKILMDRSSRSEVYYKKSVLRNFAKFKWKHLRQRLFFNKVASLKRLWHRCFPVKFEKFLRTPFLTEHLWWLLPNGEQYFFPF